MQLETTDTRNRSRGGADFRRIIRKGRNIIAIERGGIGELVAGNLHAIAGIAREAYDRLVEHFTPGFYWWNFRECRHSCPNLRTSMNSQVPHRGVWLNHKDEAVRGKDGFKGSPPGAETK